MTNRPIHVQKLPWRYNLKISPRSDALSADFNGPANPFLELGNYAIFDFIKVIPLALSHGNLWLRRNTITKKLSLSPTSSA